ncbi:FG-GAP-like repeat-containing protein [Candidatus Cyanaurora vandensis]|uniref:FG-GAP-like repeat-containing protein n=1 Tax=Candidatus Cyanaurora vandensis TaxID=2714958 RepID=UPI00257F5E23|nr:FG-GAP-like repeat-containing protein [Candidatus Cyanaurora vandensis]
MLSKNSWCHFRRSALGLAATLMLTVSVQAQIDFSPAQTVNIRDRPVVVVTGDLDNDGDLDFVTGSAIYDRYYDSSVTTSLNNGNGTFTNRSQFLFPSTNYLLTDLTLGDFDEDGDLDVALTSSSQVFGSPSVTLLKNRGNGTFGSGERIFTPVGYPYAIVSGDLDSDGDLDLAFSSAGNNRVQVLRNNGNATFTTGQSFGVGRNPRGLAIGDLNGDGDLDLVTANLDNDTVSVAANNGNATFATPTAVTAGDGPRGVTLADLDGDGDLDVTTANNKGDNVAVLRNQGNGTLASPVFTAAGNGPSEIAAGDFDGDDDLDLAIANRYSDNVTVLTNQGDSTFTGPLVFAAGNGAVSVATGDLDQGGDLDLVVANSIYGDVSVLFNTTATFAPSISSFTPTGGGVGTVVTITGTNLGSATAVQFNGTNAPFQVISDTQLLAVAPPELTSGPITVVNPGGTATSTTSFMRTATPTIVALSPQRGFVGTVVTINGTRLSTTSAVSFNGAPAVFVVNSNTKLTALVPEGAKSGPVTVTTSEGTATSPLDFTVTAPLLVFTPPVDYPVTATPVVIDRGDLDGDGDLDLVTASNVAPQPSLITVLLNAGNGTFVNSGDFPLGTEPFNSPFESEVGDLDGDGDLDLAFTTSDGTYVLFNSGVATFSPAQQLTTGFTIGLTAADLDGDLDLDLAATNRDLDTVTVLKNNGNGTFIPHTLATAYFPLAITSADLDGDLDQDLAVLSAFGELAVFKNNGNATFAPPLLSLADSNANSLAPGDLDGDGDLDLATANGNSFNSSVLRNNGTGVFAPPEPVNLQGPGSDGNPGSVTLGDLDQDGDLDLIVGEVFTYYVNVLANNGDGTFNTPQSVTTGYNSEAVAVGDWDGDGDLDIATTDTFQDNVPVVFNITVPRAALTSFAPTSGTMGTTVFLTGRNFTTTTAVTFNGTPAPFTVLSATQLQAIVPVGATTGPLTVTNPSGTGPSDSPFVVIP